jgi:hypothetical protein
MSAPRVVCPDCGMSTWKEGFGCMLPGCANHGVLDPATVKLCDHCFGGLHGACVDSTCPCECNR